MSAKDDGGPAFPTLSELDGQINDRNVVDYIAISAAGMSLRDYFAGQVLANPTFLTTDWEVENRRDIVALAYEIADLMLKERSKP